MKISISHEQKKYYEKLINPIITIDDWIKIVDSEDPEIVQNFRSWISNWPENEGNFKTITNIGIDKNYFYDKITSIDTKTKLTIKNIDDLLNGGRIASIDKNVSIDDYTKLKIFQYRIGIANKLKSEFNLKEIGNIVQEALKIKNMNLAIHNQEPGGVHAWHFDSMKNYYNNLWIKEYPNKKNLKFNRKTLWADEEYIPQRFFLALDDWHPGQLFQLGTKTWQGWKVGDIMWYDWQTLPHATANASLHDRPLLRITGLTNINYIHSTATL